MPTYKEIRKSIVNDPGAQRLIKVDDSLFPLLSPIARAVVLLLRELEAEENNQRKV